MPEGCYCDIHKEVRPMFTGKPLPPLPLPLSGEDWANGMIHFAKQDFLDFGQNRRVRVKTRLVVAIRTNGARLVVLPCTSQDESDSKEFFELNDERVMWVRKPKYDKSYANCEYDTIHENALSDKKVAVLRHPARLDIIRWLREIGSTVGL